MPEYKAEIEQTETENFKAEAKKINDEISSLKSELSQNRNLFRESMQAQGWAYIDTEYKAYGETYGLSARLLSPEFLAKHDLTREVEGRYEYKGIEGTTYLRDRIDDVDIDWDEEDEKEVIYL